MATTENQRLGMLVDLSVCIGCNACVVACKMENDVPLTKFNTWIESWDAGTYPQVARANLPKLCNHCADAPCVSVCPTGASYMTESGIIMVDEERCIGCKYCMAACPFQVRWQDPSEGTVGKCTFCYHRTSQGLLPACVSACPTHARMFGDLNDPDSDVVRHMAETSVEPLRSDIDLDVAVHYVGLSETLEAPVASNTWHGGKVVRPLP